MDDCFLRVLSVCCRYTEAEEDCSKAISLDSTYTKAFARRATARVALGKLEEAKQGAALYIIVYFLFLLLEAQKAAADKVVFFFLSDYCWFYVCVALERGLFVCFRFSGGLKTGTREQTGPEWTPEISDCMF